MLNRQKRGFSLIELMVAVLIISILAAVSGPVYKSYVVKSKFADVFKDISKYKEDMAAAYLDSDAFPSQISGVPLTTYTLITSSVLKLLYYGRSTNKQAAYMHFYTLDLGISGYTEVANNGTGGTKCRITIAAVATDAGHLRFYCGQWDGTTVNVPLENLPKSCQDTGISALIT